MLNKVNFCRLWECQNFMFHGENFVFDLETYFRVQFRAVKLESQFVINGFLTPTIYYSLDGLIDNFTLHNFSAIKRS